jgi:HEAT repeat protein
MRTTSPIILLLSTLPLFAADNADINDLLAKLPNIPPETHKPIVEKLAAGRQGTLEQILSQIKEPGKGDDRNARYALHALALHAGAPGNDSYRHTFSTTIDTPLRSEIAPAVKVFLIEQAVFAGAFSGGHRFLLNEELGSACARAAIALRDDAMLRMVGGILADVSASEPFPRTAADIIQAAGVLKQTASGEFERFLSRGDAALRISARRALATDAKPEYVDIVLKGLQAQDPFEHRQSLDSALLLARRLTESNHRPQAEKVYRHLLTTHADTPHIQSAALQGLAQTLPTDQSLPLLLETLTRDPRGSATTHDHLALQLAALQTAATLPGRAVTRALLKQIDVVPPDLAARILESLATRGDPDALEGVLALTKDTDPIVRHAAMTTAAILGGERSIPTLIDLLKNDPDRAAAQQALAKAPGQPATAAIAHAIPETQQPAAKAALLHVLAARDAADQLDVITAALKDESDQVRAAAATALGTIGQPTHTADLLTFLSTAKTDTDRAAAESSILTLARLTPDATQRANPLLAALPKTTDLSNRAALLRILGKLGAPAALVPLRAALADHNEQIKDAAVRALAAWPTPDDPALAQLLGLVKSADIPNTHRVLALRAYIRLAGQQQLPPDRRLDMYRQSLALAKTPDDKKLALAGLADLRDPRALPLLTPLLDDEGTQQEAASAILRVTREMRAPNEELKVILQKIVSIARDERVKREASSRLQTLGAK